MSLSQLRASLALWRRREAFRKSRHTHWQRRLQRARERDVHPRQELVDKRDRWSKLLDEARMMVARRERQIRSKVGPSRPHESFRLDVPNQSSRGVKPRLIVLHSTESSNSDGLADLRAIGSWFSNPRARSSSHVCVDSEGNSCRYVPDGRKAWHCASFNPQSLGVEQIGRAAQGHWPEAQLRKTARYVAYWSKKYDIPLRRSTVSGVCTHKELGAAGGGHHDPGSAYNVNRVLELARAYR